MKRSSKRRDCVKYVDPVTGLTEYRYVEKVTYRYEDEEKVPIVIEFLTGETSAEKMVEKITFARCKHFMRGLEGMCLRKICYLCRTKTMKIWQIEAKMTRLGS